MDNKEKIYGEEIPAEVYEIAALLICFAHELDVSYSKAAEGRLKDE